MTGGGGRRQRQAHGQRRGRGMICPSKVVLMMVAGLLLLSVSASAASPAPAAAAPTTATHALPSSSGSTSSSAMNTTTAAENKKKKAQEEEADAAKMAAQEVLKESYHVVDLPGLPSDVEFADQYAGYIPVESSVVNGTSKGGRLFFWLHESQTSSEDPLVIWLNGGPGCSSLLGMLFECGPFRLPNPHAHNHPKKDRRAGGRARRLLEDNDRFLSNATPEEGGKEGGREEGGDIPTLIANPYGWNKAQHLLFVEQPVETGFAYSQGHTYVQDEQDLSIDFYGFLRNFFEVFPEKAKNKLFIFGESYAGMYAPAIAKEIHLQNQLETNVNNTINLKGLALGNGWVDPKLQTASYSSYAFSHSLVDEEGKTWLEEEFKDCLKRIDLGVGEENARSGDLEACGILEKTLNVAGQPNEFDISTYIKYDSLLSPDAPLSHFLNDARVEQAIHVRGENLPGVGKEGKDGGLPTGDGNRPWSICNDGIAMTQDHPFSMLPTLAGLLDEGYKVLLYNGENDLSCNYLGTQAYIESMKWSGMEGWKEGGRAHWRVREGRRRRRLTSNTTENLATIEAGKPSLPPSLHPLLPPPPTPPTHTNEGGREEGVVAGFVRSTGPLTFLVVLDSGHLLPMDQPARALDLVYRFTRGLSFADSLLPQPWKKSKEEGHGGREGPIPLEAPAEAAKRLRREGWREGGLWAYVGIFVLVCVVGLMGSGLFAAWRRRKRRGGAGYEGVGEGEGEGRREDEGGWGGRAAPGGGWRGERNGT